MIKKIFLILLGAGLILSCKSNPPNQNNTTPPDHNIWTSLLKQHVKDKGSVDYKGFKNDREKLKAYLETLSDTPPDKNKWTREEQIAYWINAYNAFTIELVLRHYPLESIKDIGSFIQIPFVNTPWDIKFIEIGGEKLDLNNIEHSILRGEFEEPRIHFAVNCASISCPKLRREAYTGDKLDEQLDAQAREFINDLDKNKISNDEVEISKIFKWYGGDFTDGQSLREYINQFSNTKINEDTDIDYMDYDWGLNEGN